MTVQIHGRVRTRDAAGGGAEGARGIGGRPSQPADMPVIGAVAIIALNYNYSPLQSNPFQVFIININSQ